MVVDAFLLVCLFVSFSLFLISARRVLYLISPVCFCPLIRVPKRVFGVLGRVAKNLTPGVTGRSIAKVSYEFCLDDRRKRILSRNNRLCKSQWRINFIRFYVIYELINLKNLQLLGKITLLAQLNVALITHSILADDITPGEVILADDVTFVASRANARA